MLSLLLSLYWTFAKIGLFTLGGGYAMIPLMEAEIINRYGCDRPRVPGYSRHRRNDAGR